MTTEIDAEGLAALIARAEDFIAHPNVHFHYKDGPEVMQGLLDALRATTRTSEAEPVAWQRRHRHEPNGPGSTGVWTQCPASEATGHFDRNPRYEYRPLYAAPLPTPAIDDQVEAVTDEGVLKAAIAIKRVFYERMDLGPEGDKELTLLDAAHLARAALLAAMGSTKP